MSSIQSKPFANKRYLFPSLIIIALLDFALSFFAAPTWTFSILLAGIIIVILWLGWTLFGDRLEQFDYLITTLMIFLVLRSITTELSFPGWWSTVWLVALVPLGIWAVWYVIKEWRNTSDRQANSSE
ncbi:MAG: hypothetical protein GFH27_549283n254 [Chloroflexi bacterium AL-W]|nr:hypothetical protein [Chloroflexi bacterium AL-N1]NOK64626.1 hypothetical protein [Chloroflexi bacterium AL-N10]NOK75867.1 hypothetical protein [Chloroflexi bacterium AL-N5]NOK80375.1 hypothetical protein [Chloroflexi bacterium AL-W]NOK86888.1 hypothetical protein [Chloroflexi bacterium AL-N15]